MGFYYNGKKVRNLYYNGKCITQLALGKEMTRLVEGDDFVRAQWLKGDGSAKINTLHNINEELGVDTKVYLPTNTFLYWYRDGTLTCHNMINNGNLGSTQIARFANNSSPLLFSQSGAVELTVTMQNNTATVNGTQYTLNPKTTYDQTFFLYDILLKDTSSISPWTSSGVKCAYFKFMDANGTTIQNLTPCRLLRPIPATLDGNGIARNAGECGMLDLKTMKFYGNVNTIGTFTVSDN